MERMRKISCGLLAAVLVLCLAACGGAKKSVTVENMTGKWQRETTYLPQYNCDADMVVALTGDGTYDKKLVNHETGAVLWQENGTWTVEENSVVCAKNEAMFTSYTYDPATDTLENADMIYQRITQTP